MTAEPRSEAAMARVMVLLVSVGLLLAGGHALLDASPSFGQSAAPGASGLRNAGSTNAAELAAPATSSMAGTVEGVVHLESVAAESPPMLSPYSRRRYQPPSTPSGGQLTPENVVVYVVAGSAGPSEPTSTTSAAPPSTATAGGAEAPGGARGSADRSAAVITQRNRTIIPHVTSVPVGTRIDFPNEDDVFHNLFSLSDARPFNLGRYPPGESRSVVFDRPGVVRMFCDIHSEMTAVIRVLETPHFTRPASDGSFRLRGVPEGMQTIVAWHDQLGTDTVEVEISPTSAATVELRLPR